MACWASVWKKLPAALVHQGHRTRARVCWWPDQNSRIRENGWHIAGDHLECAYRWCSASGIVKITSYPMAWGNPCTPSVTVFFSRCWDKTEVFFAGLPKDFSPGFNQNAIWLSVLSTLPFAVNACNTLELLGPPRQARPPSVGLNVSGTKRDPASKLEADCNCRP